MALLALALPPLSLSACSGDDEESSDPVAASCPGFYPEADVKHEVTGRHGSFIDHCDNDGNLVEYGCLLTSQTLCEGPYCREIWSQADEVEPTTLDCDGTCHDGVCIDR